MDSKKPVMIFGAGGMASAALEVFLSHQVLVYGFLDDDTKLHGTEIQGVSVLGKTDDDGFLKFIGKKCEAFIATEDLGLRKGLVKLLKERRKVMPMNAIHQSARVSEHCHLEYGIFVNMGACIGAESKIGAHSQIHAQVTIDYKVTMGEFVSVGAGATVGANCEIGNEVFIGTGATIVPGIKIGKGARIGAGSVVIQDVEAKSTVFGNPAQPFDIDKKSKK